MPAAGQVQLSYPNRTQPSQNHSISLYKALTRPSYKVQFAKPLTEPTQPSATKPTGTRPPKTDLMWDTRHTRAGQQLLQGCAVLAWL